ncbi:MAG: RNA polymerase sporulation sigma factor SigH [Candidatus Subteraquimicrobiales bacterium]|nr:RNA polymerase sporulation sigma factor SigH [Candidatus Subteraquimicrobiales bacterium]
MQADIEKEKSTNYTYLSLGELNDLQLVEAAQNGNELALERLLERYKGFICSKARTYFLIGADKDDLIQEGMIGLYKAVRDFCSDKETSFRTFAELCVTRQMITAIKTATRQKHTPLNLYVSLDKPVEARNNFKGQPVGTLMETIAGVDDPVETVIKCDELKRVRPGYGLVLSELEAQVLRLYLEGKSYREIAFDLERHVKSVDNALQRIKSKLKDQLVSPA